MEPYNRDYAHKSCLYPEGNAILQVASKHHDCAHKEWSDWAVRCGNVSKGVTECCSLCALPKISRLTLPKAPSAKKKCIACM